MTETSARITSCRSCESSALSTILDLKPQPLANALLLEEDLDKPEAIFPLEVLACEACGLLQVSETVPPSILFADDYPYFSSFIPALLTHSKEHADALMEEFSLGADDLVVEIASNDGYLLRNFIAANVPVLGVDPANGPVEAGIAAGVPTEKAFFGVETALRLLAKGKSAKVMIANNVLAHVTDINDFVAGFALLLRHDGIAEFEFPYVRNMIDRCAFDTIYHEHVFYYSLTALAPLFGRHGLYLNDATLLDIHGGSLRLRVSKTPGQSERLKTMFAEERQLGIDSLSYYRDFAERVTQIRNELRDMLASFRAQGKSIAAYGAAAKGATLLNYAQLPKGTIEFVVDRNEHKVGKYMPGVKLPIYDVRTLTALQPDYVLILTWNFAEEIIEQQREYSDAGGIFLSAMPFPHVVVGHTAQLRGNGEGFWKAAAGYTGVLLASKADVIAPFITG